MPSGPARIAADAMPRNRPCSTTPGIAWSAPDSALGSGMRPKDASMMKCPPSVTKGAPSRILQRRAPRKGRGGGGAADGEPGRLEAETVDLDRQREARRASSTSFERSAMTIIRGGGRRHDLFAQQRAAAALDQRQIGIDLVGAVDGQIELRRLVERRQRHAEFQAKRRGALGGRHADDLQPALDALGQQPDELFRRRAGADAEPHAVLDMAERCARGLDLEGRCVHEGMCCDGHSAPLLPSLPATAKAFGGSKCQACLPDRPRTAKRRPIKSQPSRTACARRSSSSTSTAR